MVNKRTFRGEAVLRLRRRLEADARCVFLAALGDVESLGSRVASLSAAMDAHDDEVRRAVRVGADAATLGAYRQCAVGIRWALTVERRRLQTARETLRRRRVGLLEAMKDRKVLARLRDRLARRSGLSRDRTETRQRDDAHAAHRAAKGNE